MSRITTMQTRCSVLFVLSTCGVLAQDTRIVCNGTPYNNTTIQNCINQCPSADSGSARGCDVQLMPGTYTLSAPITMGNGNDGSLSTVNYVRLRGAGSGLTLGEAGQPKYGTKLQYTGSTAGPAIYIYGPAVGMEVHNLLFDGLTNATMQTAVNAIHCNRCVFSDLVATRWTYYAFIEDGYSTTQNQTYPLCTGKNTWKNIHAYNPYSSGGGSYAHGFLIGPPTKYAACGLSKSSYSNINLSLQTGEYRGNGVGLHIRAADYLTFSNVAIDSVAHAVFLTTVEGNNSAPGYASQYPTSLTFLNFSGARSTYQMIYRYSNQNPAVYSNPRMVFAGFHTQDGEQVPDLEGVSGITDTGISFVNGKLGVGDAGTGRTMTLSNCTLTFRGGILTSASGSGCP